MHSMIKRYEEIIVKSESQKICHKGVQLPYKNWKAEFQFPAEWSERTKFAAKMIDSNWDVIEFGAGNGILGDFLSKSQVYLQTDIVKRNEK